MGGIGGNNANGDRSSFCIVGAIEETSRLLRGRLTSREEKGLVCRLFDQLSLPGWNDAPGRTREEVVAKLREAAECA